MDFPEGAGNPGEPFIPKSSAVHRNRADLFLLSLDPRQPGRKGSFFRIWSFGIHGIPLHPVNPKEFRAMGVAGDNSGTDRGGRAYR
jgi:hypothetical protein